jgi:hypothetical protein
VAISVTWNVKWTDIPECESVTDSYKRSMVLLCQEKMIQTVSKEFRVPYITLECWFYEYVEAWLPQPNETDTPKLVFVDEFMLKKGVRMAWHGRTTRRSMSGRSHMDYKKTISCRFTSMVV